MRTIITPRITDIVSGAEIKLNAIVSIIIKDITYNIASINFFI